MLLCAPFWIGQRTLMLCRSPSSKSRARAQRTSRRRASRSGGSSSRRMSAPTTMYSRSCRCGRSGALPCTWPCPHIDPCGSSAGVPTLAPAPRIQCGRLCFGGALRAVSSHTLLVRWCTLHGARCMLRRRRLVVLVHKKHVPYVTNVQSSYEATGACKHLTLCHHLAQSCLPFDETLASLLLRASRAQPRPSHTMPLCALIAAS